MARKNTSSPQKSRSTPSYRRQRRPSGKHDAFVDIDGRRIYLGTYDSPESREKYHRLIAQWMAIGSAEPAKPGEVTVAEIANQYRIWSEAYYVKNGRKTAEPTNIILALRPLLKLYGLSKAAEFGPRALKTVRQEMVNWGWSRKYINKHVGRIKRMFKWAVAEELVPPSVHEGLRAVTGLKYGRSSARETGSVRPAPDDMIEAVRQHVSRQVAAMIDLQLLTGARPGEIVQMRPCDIDRSGQVWVYRPVEHKTEHHGHERLIFLGPKAQEILTPFLLRQQDACCFSPAEAEAERRQAMAIARKTPLSCGNIPGGNRKAGRKRPAGGHYTTGSYRRAIDRGLEWAFPPPSHLAKRDDETHKQHRARLTAKEKAAIKAWRDEHHWHPHQLRHNYATRVRSEYGLEAAQILLGHSKADVTQIYAERDMGRAADVAAKIG